MKVCLACSAGGHLTEILQLEESYIGHPHFFLTFEREDTCGLSEKESVYFVKDPKRNPIKLIVNFFQSLGIFLRERPDIVITTGAGIVIPFCFISKLFGRKLIFIESFCRTETPSFTGKLVYKISDIFLVQWKPLLKKYGPKARYWGGVF